MSVGGGPALDPEVVEGAHAVFEHLNGNHADSVLFLASHVADAALVDAELTSVDAGGVDIDARDARGALTVRLVFDAPVSTTAELQGQLLGRLQEARADAPDGPPTSIETEIARQNDIPTRVVEVEAVADVAPGLRQLTFGGLRGHRPLGPDDFFLVIRPRPGLEHQLHDGVSFQQFRDLPAGEVPHWAYYTCRRWRPEEGELDAWFVLHDHDGPISGWARHAQPGERVALWGPRSSFDPPEATTSLLLVGDETGLAAFAAVLEQADPSIAVQVLVECDDGQPVVELPARPGAEVTWVGRRGRERGTGTQLLDAVAALDPDPAGLYAYGAGESRLVTAVRKHLRHDRAIPGPQVQMVGYWRRT